MGKGRDGGRGMRGNWLVCRIHEKTYSNFKSFFLKNNKK